MDLGDLHANSVRYQPVGITRGYACICVVCAFAVSVGVDLDSLHLCLYGSVVRFFRFFLVFSSFFFFFRVFVGLSAGGGLSPKGAIGFDFACWG